MNVRFTFCITPHTVKYRKNFQWKNVRIIYSLKNFIAKKKGRGGGGGIWVRVTEKLKNMSGRRGGVGNYKQKLMAKLSCAWLNTSFITIKF